MRPGIVIAFAGGVTILACGLTPASVQAQTGFWYYCDAAKAYYPYVRYCASPWRPVQTTTQPLPGTAPSSTDRRLLLTSEEECQKPEILRAIIHFLNAKVGLPRGPQALIQNAKLHQVENGEIHAPTLTCAGYLETASGSLGPGRVALTFASSGFNLWDAFPNGAEWETDADVQEAAQRVQVQEQQRQAAARSQDKEEQELWQHDHPGESIVAVRAAWHQMQIAQARCYAMVESPISGQLGTAAAQNPENFDLWLASHDAQRTAESVAVKSCGERMAANPRFDESHQQLVIGPGGKTTSHSLAEDLGAQNLTSCFLGSHSLGQVSEGKCSAYTMAFMDLSDRGTAAMADCLNDLKSVFPDVHQRQSSCRALLTDVFPFLTAR